MKKKGGKLAGSSCYLVDKNVRRRFPVLAGRDMQSQFVAPLGGGTTRESWHAHMGSHSMETWRKNSFWRRSGTRMGAEALLGGFTMCPNRLRVAAGMTGLSAGAAWGEFCDRDSGRLVLSPT